MSVWRDLYMKNCTFLNIAHDAFSYLYIENEKFAIIDGLKFINVIGAPLKKSNSFILTAMVPDSILIVKNLIFQNSTLNVVKGISIQNSLNQLVIEDSMFEKSTIMSNTIAISTFDTKQLIIKNLSTNRFTYLNSSTGSGSYLLSIDKIDLNSTMNSSLSDL